jgi:hypothetical protein
MLVTATITQLLTEDSSVIKDAFSNLSKCVVKSTNTLTSKAAHYFHTRWKAFPSDLQKNCALHTRLTAKNIQWKILRIVYFTNNIIHYSGTV